MRLGVREFWTVLHGMLFGAAYLLAFAGGLAGLWSLRPAWLTAEGARERMRRLQLGLWMMAIICWATVISGTWVVYPWYRDPAKSSPRSQLLAVTDMAAWHTFGMEWKEHVAWLSPILATAAAALLQRYKDDLARRDDLRRATTTLFVLAFLAAMVAGIFGAFINKVAPILDR
ncbi:MAG: hypothetical protein HY719_06490 [Planctomycetes bacterium]|nr:hypothetical protein [Planctomycetota bacterium]